MIQMDCYIEYHCLPNFIDINQVPNGKTNNEYLISLQSNHMIEHYINGFVSLPVTYTASDIKDYILRTYRLVNYYICWYKVSVFNNDNVNTIARYIRHHDFVIKYRDTNLYNYLLNDENNTDVYYDINGMSATINVTEHLLRLV